MSEPIVEIRRVTLGSNRQLEYRYRPIRIDAWGNLRGLDEWSNWMIVAEVDGDEAAMQDLIASGGIAGAP